MQAVGPAWWHDPPLEAGRLTSSVVLRHTVEHLLVWRTQGHWLADSGCAITWNKIGKVRLGKDAPTEYQVLFTFSQVYFGFVLIVCKCVYVCVYWCVGIFVYVWCMHMYVWKLENNLVCHGSSSVIHTVFLRQVLSQRPTLFRVSSQGIPGIYNSLSDWGQAYKLALPWGSCYLGAGP